MVMCFLCRTVLSSTSLITAGSRLKRVRPRPTVEWWRETTWCTGSQLPRRRRRTNGSTASSELTWLRSKLLSASDKCLHNWSRFALVYFSGGKNEFSRCTLVQTCTPCNMSLTNRTLKLEIWCKCWMKWNWNSDAITAKCDPGAQKQC